MIKTRIYYALYMPSTGDFLFQVGTHEIRKYDFISQARQDKAQFVIEHDLFKPKNLKIVRAKETIEIIKEYKG